MAEIDYPLILRKHRIKFTGLECPNPVMSITQLFTQGEKFGLDLENESNKVLRSNWETMGLGTPTAVQMAAWGIMLDVRSHIITRFRLDLLYTYDWTRIHRNATPSSALLQAQERPSPSSSPSCSLILLRRPLPHHPRRESIDRRASSSNLLEN